jgi:hypothetical protein
MQMTKFFSIITAISMFGFSVPAAAQIKYNPYGVDNTIILTPPTSEQNSGVPINYYPNAPENYYPTTPDDTSMMTPYYQPNYQPLGPLKYSPYGTESTINLSGPSTGSQVNAPGYYSPNYPEGCNTDCNGSYGVCAAACTDAEFQEYFNDKGYQGVACASRAGEVAGISCCEMLAAAALVGAIAVIALVFNHGHSAH